MWIVGLAVPVTASYIMCAVIAAPALIKLGVPDFAAHMFIFYYAVLSEVSPPTALSPFAAAAITGGNPYLTTLQSWKYTMPAFLVPFVFVLDPQGVGLLLKVPRAAAGSTSSRSCCRDAAGIAMLALRLPGPVPERSSAAGDGMLTVGGMLLVFPELIGAILGLAKRGARLSASIGLALAVLVLLMQWMWPSAHGARAAARRRE